MINKDKIHSLVSVFYQPTFKTFYVNSDNGITFTKPIGIFVSLGITTSMKVLEDIREIIINDGKYEADIAEISSKKVNNQFLNTVLNKTNPTQYKLVELPEDTLDEKAAKDELNKMRELMNPNQDLSILKKYAPKISKLQDLIQKLDNSNGWDAHLIQKIEEDNYKIFHQYVNYKKEGEIEYRIGIYVYERDN